MKIQSNNTGSFTKNDSVSFDFSLWSATNGTVDWSKYPNFTPYNEEDVFRTELAHTTTGIGVEDDIGWTARIGKGGQIYYLDVRGVGQIICPQRYFSAWNDDCMTTTVYGGEVVNDDSELKINGDSYANGYIHGSGMYSKPHMDPLNNKPFFCPLLAEEFDQNDRSYTAINWGLIPKPSINRGDVLFYSRYRDMGNGVLELTFYCYNFGNRVYNFAEIPWFAFRPSKYPNMIEGINGTSDFKVNNKNFGDGAISKSGGWGAGTVNPYDHDSKTCALVWGNKTLGLAVNFGFVNKQERDMMLIAPSYALLNLPFGNGFYCRRYLVFGNLKHVSKTCSELNQHAVVNYVEFNKAETRKIPLYKTTYEDYESLTTIPSEHVFCYVYATPVKGSYPLFLLRNTETLEYWLTTDPYAICDKQPFSNPYPSNHPKHEEYNNKVIYQPYDGKTEWVKLLGYVITTDMRDETEQYVSLSELFGPTVKFLQGEKLDSSELFAIRP